MPRLCASNLYASSVASSPGSTSASRLALSICWIVADTCSSRRVLAGAIYTGAAFTWIHFVLGPTIEIVDEEEEDEGEQEGDWEEDEEWEDDALFIPLGWATPAPRKFYKGSDPEWQEFRKIAADPKRHDRIRRTYG